MHCSNVDTTCKVIVVGNGEVGKSSMLNWYCKGDFTEDYKKTIGMRVSVPLSSTPTPTQARTT